MLDNLMASAPKRHGLGGRLSSNAVSVSVHAVIVSFAVFATMKPKAVDVFPVEIDPTSFVVPQTKAESPPPLPFDVPRRTVFNTSVAPVQVPTGIPPIDSGVIFDPHSFEGLAPERVFEDLHESGSSDVSGVFVGAAVDEEPIRISSPPLEYPLAMQRAGIEGIVVLQAIVDTAGKVELGSVRVIQSDNVAFEGAAKRLVQRSIFRPGRVGGKPVRVLIQLPVEFRLIDHPL